MPLERTWIYLILPSLKMFLGVLLVMAFRASTQHARDCVPLPSLLHSFILKPVPNSDWLFPKHLCRFSRDDNFPWLFILSVLLFVKYSSKVITSNGIMSERKERVHISIYFKGVTHILCLFSGIFIHINH